MLLILKCNYYADIVLSHETEPSNKFMRRFLDQFKHEWKANGPDFLTWTKSSKEPLTKLNYDYLMFDASGEPHLPPLDAFTKVVILRDCGLGEPAFSDSINTGACAING